MRRKEAPIVAEIIRYIRSLRCGWAVKTHGGPFTAGQPDITGCVLGRAVFLEVKRDEKQKATPLQEVMLRKWSDAGAVTGVVCSVEEVVKLFTRHGIVG